MGKSKDSKSSNGTKALTAVKEGRVTKPEVSSKKSGKHDSAKTAKVSKRAPTPDSESSSDSDADSDSASDDDVDDNSSASSDSSDSEAEQKPAKTQSSKVNGAAKVANGVKPTVNDDDDDDSSEGSDSDDEAPARTSKAAPNGKSAATGAGQDDDASSDSSDSSDESDNEGKPALNGKAAKKADKSADDSDDSEGSSESDSDEEVAAQPEPIKKRKADFTEAPAAKKAKAFEGEAGGAVANLFVGNLSWNVDEEWLRREFEEFGEVVGCRIITDRESGRSKGFGYVEFAAIEDATKALETKKGGLLDGRELNIDYSTPRPKTQNSDRGQWTHDRANKFGDVKGEPTATLWVGNISFNASSDDINNAFAEYGTITRVALPTDMETGAPKGYGYVDFTTVEEAQAAYEGLNGYDIAGRSIRIDYATPRTGGGDRGGRGRGGFGGFNDRGRGGRGGFNDRGRGGRGGRGGFNDRGRGGGRGNFSKNRGGLGDFSGTKVTF